MILMKHQTLNILHFKINNKTIKDYLILIIKDYQINIMLLKSLLNCQNLKLNNKFKELMKRGQRQEILILIKIA